MNSSTSNSEGTRRTLLARAGRRYVVAFLLCLAVAAGALAAFNVWVDPYDVFHLARGKTEPIRYGNSTRMSKAYAIRARRPDCLLLGTSRTAIGYRTDFPALKDCERPYNEGLQKSHLYEARRYLQHALAQNGGLKRVVVGLDFESFRNTDRTLEDYTEERLSVSPDGKPQAWPGDELLGLALSYDATRLSILTLAAPQGLPWFTAAGDWDTRSLAEVLRIPQLGTGVVSRSAIYILRNLLTKPGAYDLAPDGRLAAFSELDLIIGLCAQNHIELTLMVNPVHVYYHEMLSAVGLKDAFDQWKRDVHKVIQAHFPQQKFWNFDLPNAWTLEPIPAEGDLQASMAGFWDPSHYRRNVGDAVLTVVLGDQNAPDAAALKDLGMDAQGAVQDGDWQARDEAAAVRIKTWLESKPAPKAGGDAAPPTGL